MNHREILWNEFQKRKLKNPLFSVRSFAKMLTVSPATLSQVMSGKRKLSLRHGQLIADRCGFDPKCRADFLSGILGNLSLVADPKPDTFHLVTQETFQLISDWYHYAILSLGEVHGSSNSPDWIAKKLGIPWRQAKQAMERLKRLHIIEITGRKFRQIAQPMTIESSIGSIAIQNHHQQMIEKAKESLTGVAVEERDISGITLAIDPADLPRVRELIKNFRREINRECNKAARKRRVYQLNIQFFPLDTEEKL